MHITIYAVNNHPTDWLDSPWDGSTMKLPDGTTLYTPCPTLDTYIHIEKIGLVSAGLHLPWELIAFTKHPQYPERCRTWEWIKKNASKWSEPERYQAYLFWKECQRLREERRLKDSDSLPDWELYRVWNQVRAK